MAEAPAHKFGQLIGNLLENLIENPLQDFCERQNLYLDKQGPRPKVRSGKKVSWHDKYDNKHDLDFVIEKDGDENTQGRPVAFIEAAWRRYTKHSKNKAQEIQGAVLPIAEKHQTDLPFLGVVLAGEFTDNSITQLTSMNFSVLHFSYESIVEAFAEVGIDASYDEQTPTADFKVMVQQVADLDEAEWEIVQGALFRDNADKIEAFFTELSETLERLVERVSITPLFGDGQTMTTIADAIAFVETHDQKAASRTFQKYEVSVKFSNGDVIEGRFAKKAKAVEFLTYVSS